MSLLSAVYCLGAGGTPPLGTPQQGSLGGHLFLLFGSLFADGGTQVNSGGVGSSWPFQFLCSPLEEKAGREGSFVGRISQYPQGVHTG